MKRLQKYITILMLLAVLLPAVSAVNYPQLTGYVTDNANILTPEYKEKITDLADRINKNTTVEIAVLTIESLEGVLKIMLLILLGKMELGKRIKTMDY